MVDEGSDVSLRCVARGSPQPSITWKREDGQFISTKAGPGGKVSDFLVDKSVDKLIMSNNYISRCYCSYPTVSSTGGESLNITDVKRDDMGPYLCIASNGIPPSVSKRIMMVVQCEYYLQFAMYNEDF